ncbi:MAG: SigB/SigF/SigG family RNA polymerase sigma factor [Clostridiales bacterium]|nr:SigB/SigF/SigG family RNA polymerase sigma factor [Clostridiales bacterium]MCI6435650.1 SigB/SigF/SigG family RNA polymerase sigma factor [Clostridiales bacterium]
MSRTEELIRLAQKGDRGACEQLINENSGLIWSVARRFIGRGAETDDLYQLGCLGFLKAVEGFDLEFGTQFSTYAVPKISGEIRRFLRDDGTLKVSRSLKEQAASIRSVRSKLTTLLGREPTIQELSDQTGFSPEEIAMAETATAATESIHQETGEDGFCLENVLTDTESEEQMVEKIALRQAVEKLPERERLVIQLRYYHSLTQQRVAKVMNVSQVQVSRIEKKALEKIREFMR